MSFVEFALFVGLGINDFDFCPDLHLATLCTYSSEF